MDSSKENETTNKNVVVHRDLGHNLINLPLMMGDCCAHALIAGLIFLSY